MDWTVALEHTGGDMDLLRELAAMFVEDFPRRAHDARTAISRGDAATLEREAHTMKGRMAFFGIEAIREQAANLEQLGRQTMLEDADRLLDEVEMAIQAVLPEFQALSLAP